ncbi:uncharacterized protein LY89DRAFT_700035 [Mollisia scopiformis]|uniref:C2H2-type domain-containing protein n=1 Tax=Mollisia scopiformis TaxID=149040 RepID=A0A194WWV9_MOLSC|nr:uncharacterized protein LY89DRAFT_700035 [Mollisia scopiformis]KUJ12072.1 hypothetical protein LY89DRAFT_700035 [Mollisia scopiformis]
MDIPHRAARPAMALPTPEIYVQDPSDRFRTSSRSNSYGSILSPKTSSIPMSIPNSREPGPPPPLPPPRHLQDIVDSGKSGPDLAWKFGNSHEYNSDWGGSVSSSVAPGSSLYGSFMGRRGDERSERRGSSISTIKSTDFKENSYPRLDEGYVSQSGTSIGSNFSKYQDSISPAAGFQSSVHDKYRSNNAQAYDKSLLQKLDARRGTDNSTPPGYNKSIFSSSANDTSPTSRIALEHRHPSQLKPLSLPIITSRPGLVESPLSRWAADTPLSGISPGGNSYYKFGGQGQFDHRSPSDTAESDRSPLPYIKRSGSGSVPDDASSVTSRSRESYDHRVSPDHDAEFHMEETGFTRLQIDDYSNRSDGYSPGATVGQKRRASSPPGDDGPSLHTVGSASDLFRRRESGSRTSPSPRFHSTSGSVSSTASGPRNNSYASSLSVAASSITSMGSYGKLSPGNVSPGGMDLDSPYITSNPSPRSSISRAHHQRNVSETRPLLTSRKLSDSAPHSKHNNAPSKLQGVFMCECCPKKPKKFDSQEELNVHEQEKQYQCAYCCNRFKNKNEAERHQNSLHLRRHSWSCAALSGYAAAFHNSPTRPNEADTCGYCGEDFPRSGISSPAVSGPPVSVATDQDWEVRIGHLQEMHKFGECNHAKKFFRADHFRQHLKHSHAGTSGKWTNMLENACMKDEPLPEPIRGPERVSPGGVRVGRISEEEEMEIL